MNHGVCVYVRAAQIQKVPPEEVLDKGIQGVYIFISFLLFVAYLLVSQKEKAL